MGVLLFQLFAKNDAGERDPEKYEHDGYENQVSSAHFLFSNCAT
jgi:hypothetical protein